MHMRPRPAAGLQPTAAVLRADRIHRPFSSRGARSGRWRLEMPIGGLRIGTTDAQGHGFVIAATGDLERQRQSDRRGTIWQRQGAHLQQIAEACETRRPRVRAACYEIAMISSS